MPIILHIYSLAHIHIHKLINFLWLLLMNLSYKFLSSTNQLTCQINCVVFIFRTMLNGMNQFLAESVNETIKRNHAPIYVLYMYVFLSTVEDHKIIIKIISFNSLRLRPKLLVNFLLKLNTNCLIDGWMDGWMTDADLSWAIKYFIVLRYKYTYRLIIIEKWSNCSLNLKIIHTEIYAAPVSLPSNIFNLFKSLNYKSETDMKSFIFIYFQITNERKTERKMCHECKLNCN